jgi:hypothetical protein
MEMDAQAETNETLLVDLKTAAAILGLARSSVRLLVAREELPAIKAGKGGKLFIPRHSLTKFVDRLR